MSDFNKNLFVKILNLFNSGSMLGRSSRQYYGQEGIGDVFAEAKAICEVRYLLNSCVFFTYRLIFAEFSGWKSVQSKGFI